MSTCPRKAGSSSATTSRWKAALAASTPPAATALYIFPVIAAFANTAGKLLKNAFLFAFMHFPSTLAIAVITILPMYMTYQDLELMPLYACCWFFFGFALTAYIDSFLLYRIFRPYLEKEETPPAKGTPQK